MKSGLTVPARILWVVGLTVLLAGPATAQQGGQISGAVTDGTGAVVPGATVTALEVSTGLKQSTVTRERGQYLFPSLRPTRYDLTAEITGFRVFRRTGVELLANQSLTINVTLETGQLSEEVTVSGGAVQVDTTTSTLNEVVDHARIVNLPLNGRDVAKLTTLVPGVVVNSVSGETGKSAPGGLRLSSNGSQDRQVSFRLDGTSNTDPYFQENQAFPFPDALQEFSIQTSNYSAVHGNNAGAVVNVVTRSGTNELHGGVFEYLRDRAFNAKNFFSPERDHLRRNQFGGYVGGPIVRNRTFFFAGYQGTILRNRAGDAIAFAPTAAQRAGDFSSIATPIRDPLTGQPFPGNRIPSNRFDPAALAVLNLIPVPSGDGRLVITRDVAQDFNQGLVKLDHQLSEADHLSFRYFVHDFTNAGNYDPSNLLTYRGGSLESAVRNHNAVVSWKRNFGSSLLNEFHIGYNRVNARRAPPEGVPGMQDLGVRLPIYPTRPSIQLIRVTDFFEVGTLLEATFVRDAFEFGNRTSWVKGRHNIQFGAEFQYNRVDIENEFRRASETFFTGSVTGHALADFLLGRMDVFDQGTGEYKNNRVLYPSVFVQDDFRVTPRLTLNLGARYEPTPPWHEQQGRIMRFSIDDYQSGVRSSMYPSAPVGLTYRGDPGFPEDGTLGDYNNAGVRLGFAYDLSGDGRMSVRGGAGMFYDQHILGEFNNGAVNAPPWSIRLRVTRPQGPFSDPYQGRSDFNLITTDTIGTANAPFPRPVLVESYDERFDTPLTYNWNLTLEREVLNGWLARLAYVGSRSQNGRRTIELNPAQAGPGATTGNTDARRMFAGYGTINLFVQDRSSRYHAAQVSLTRRYSGGFTVSANYTLSKVVGNFGGSDGFGGELIPWNLPDDPSLTWGPLEQDRRHRFVTSWVWDVLGNRAGGGGGLGTALLRGWQVSGIFQYQSGAPFTVVSGRDNSLDGIGNDRARFTGAPIDPPAGSDTTLWFNPAAFAVNATGTFGEVGTGALYGPMHYTLDMSLIKNTRLSDRLNLQFRADAFNVLNHANFNLPNRNVSGGGFGRITSAQDPRIVQLSVKLEF